VNEGVRTEYVNPTRSKLLGDSDFVLVKHNPTRSKSLSN
jgi:hypothetical protein